MTTTESSVLVLILSQVQVHSLSPSRGGADDKHEESGGQVQHVSRERERREEAESGGREGGGAC